MSGPTEYSIDELKKFVKTLEDYSKNHGIFTAKINHEVEKVSKTTSLGKRAIVLRESLQLFLRVGQQVPSLRWSTISR